MVDEFIFDTFMNCYSMVSKLNTISGKIRFYKDSLNRFPKDSEGCSTIVRAVEGYIENEDLYPQDIQLLRDGLTLANIRRIATNRENGELFFFRKMAENAVIWVKVLIAVPKDYSEQKPEVLLYGRLIPQTEADKIELGSAISMKHVKMLKINLNTGQRMELYSMEGEQYKAGEYEQDYMKDMLFMTAKVIHPEELHPVQKWLDKDFLSEYFKKKDKLNFFCRRKVSGKYTWVECEAVKGVTYSSQNPVILYTVTCMNEMVLRNYADVIKRQLVNYYNHSSANHLELFVQNAIAALNFLSRPYMEFMSIDLENDVYVSYKQNDYLSLDRDELCGSYSDKIKEFANEFCAESEREAFIARTSLESIKAELVKSMTMVVKFISNTGRQMVVHYTKKIAEAGVPSIITMVASYDESEQRLLKLVTFGNFTVVNSAGQPVRFEKKQSKQVFAYMVDRRGFPITMVDIIEDVLERSPDDLNARKYASALVRKAMADLTKAGHPNVIVEENHSYRINMDAVDCDLYHVLNGDHVYWNKYHNEYMKEYSWAEETNAELMHYGDI